MQIFLGPLRSQALFNNIIKAFLTYQFRKLYLYIYILPSFYTAATVATGEGKFDMKMQDFEALKSLNCKSFRGASPPCPRTRVPTGLDWRPKRSLDPSPNFAPLTPKPGSLTPPPRY